jgi:hypothetical protein
MTIIFTRYAGLIGAPLVWAINMQLGQVLPYLDCQTRVSWSAIVTALAMLIALAGAGISYAGTAKAESDTRVFLRRISVLTALAFAFALFLQGAATLLLDACIR